MKCTRFALIGDIHSAQWECTLELHLFKVYVLLLVTLLYT